MLLDLITKRDYIINMADGPSPQEAAISTGNATEAVEPLVQSESKGYDQYFETKRPQLASTLQAAYKTSYGQEVLLQLDLDPATMKYREFTSKVPQIRSSDVAQNPKRYARGEIEKMRLSKSGGTTGKPKEFYFPDADMNVMVGPKITAAMKESKSPVLIHGDWASIDFDVIEESLQSLRPDIQVGLYTRVSQAIEHMKKGDTIFLESEVTNFRAFMHYFNETLETDPSLLETFKGKKIFLELNSEPVKFEELKTWFNRLKEVFGRAPDIYVLYGQNDTGNLGMYDYTDGDERKDFKYKVDKNRFVEVLDTEGNPLLEQEGDVVVTTFRQEGSIFIRYVTGDKGVLTVDKNADAYINEIGRKKEDGMISLYGSKLFVPGVFDLMRDKLNVPFRLEVQSVEDPNNLSQALNITLYSDNFTNTESAQEAKVTLMKALTESREYAYIPDLMEAGMLQININTLDQTPEGFIKGWRILPSKEPTAQRV